MNVLFYLIPKARVIFLEDDSTIRQALERMEYHRYTAIPILSTEGKYIGTLTEGDLLWTIKNKFNLNLHLASEVSVLEVDRHHDNVPISINKNIEDIIEMAENQNFIPVIDDMQNFIGIITRKDIIHYCKEEIKKVA